MRHSVGYFPVADKRPFSFTLLRMSIVEAIEEYLGRSAVVVRKDDGLIITVHLDTDDKDEGMMTIIGPVVRAHNQVTPFSLN